MKFIKTNDQDAITTLRKKLYQRLKSPIDAMWELLYINSSQDYLIINNDDILGYCCIDAEGSLTQIYLEDAQLSKMTPIIEQLIGSSLVKSASLSSNEPTGFNACLSLSQSTEINTFCFEHVNSSIVINNPLPLALGTIDDIPSIKAFYKAHVGMDDTFGYTENLISRKEIFILKEMDIIIATSECRVSDSQSEIADLGIIVHKEHQGKGLATIIMQMQVNKVLKAGRKPICSTTFDNISSRKVIEKSGFFCSNIIFDMKF